MDPSANLYEQIRLAKNYLRTTALADTLTPLEVEGERLADLVDVLTEWLAEGGFAPDWQAVYSRATAPR